METNSKKILEAQIKECFGRVVWTHQLQEKCADILHRRNSRYKIYQIILSVLMTTGLIVIIFGDNKWIEIASAILSAALLLINTYMKSHDLGELSQKHADAAANLWNIRESYLSLLTDIKVDVIDVEQIQSRRDKLQKDLSSIYKGAPRTISKAYTKAIRDLKNNEEVTFSDEEINKFLPEELKMS